jgi:hypothetical protein
MLGRTGYFGVLVAFCVGLAAGWFVRPQVPSTASHRVAPTKNRTQERLVRSDEPSPSAVMSAPAADVPERSREQSSAPSVTTNQVPGGDPNNIFQPGNVSAPVAADAGEMHRLLDAVRISCQFGPGHGALWKNGQPAMVTSSWQGGPIMYDQIAMADGTAMMLGSEGATGSNTGEVKVRVAATRAGLHFASFVPRGDLISTTVFAALDENRRHIAVMSMHSPGFDHNSSQFHGVCDVLY